MKCIDIMIDTLRKGKIIKIQTQSLVYFFGIVIFVTAKKRIILKNYA